MAGTLPPFPSFVFPHPVTLTSLDPSIILGSSGVNQLKTRLFSMSHAFDFIFDLTSLNAKYWYNQPFCVLFVCDNVRGEAAQADSCDAALS